MADDPLFWLQSFYVTLCNDDWEHGYGCDLRTIDNPGWRFSFDLTDTDYEELMIARSKHERSENDWVHFWKEGPKFEGACGPLNLSELLTQFRRFIEEANITDTAKA